MHASKATGMHVNVFGMYICISACMNVCVHVHIYVFMMVDRQDTVCMFVHD